MKAIEVTGKIDSQGNLILDEPIHETTYPHQVRVIVLVPEEEQEPYETPTEEVKASLIKALQQAKASQRLPLSQMWEGIDGE